DYLKSIGVDSSFANRKRLAQKYGIKNYTGTATQNIQLLNAMRDGKNPTPKPKTSSSSSITFKVGDKVTLKNTAKTYATGEKIPSRYKGKKYTNQQVKSDRVLLKELYSWVYKKDVL